MTSDRGTPTQRARLPGAIAGALIVVFGVIVPAGALWLEWYAHFTGRFFIDPVPTRLHVLLLALAPAANLAVFLGAQWGGRSMRLWDPLNGAAVGVAGIETLLFLPLLAWPVETETLYLVALRLSPLAVVGTLAATVALRVRLRRRAGEGARPTAFGLVAGMAPAMALFAMASVPSLVANVSMHAALRQRGAARADAIAFMRRRGCAEIVRRLCFDRGSRGLDLGGIDPVSAVCHLVRPVPVESARALYCRLTGENYRRRDWIIFPVPYRLARLTELNYDGPTGGLHVGPVLSRFTLVQSRLDGVIDRDGAEAKFTWRLRVENGDHRRRVLDVVLALPSGGAMARARAEAERGGRVEVSAAGEIVGGSGDLSLKTDPLPGGRLRLRCWPAPPRRAVTIDVEVRAPLVPTGPGAAALRAPFLAERNMATSGDAHEVAVRATVPLTTTDAATLRSLNAGAGDFRLYGRLSDAELAKLCVLYDGPSAAHAFGAELRAARPGRVVLVVDGSVSAGALPRIVAAALDDLRADVFFNVLVAGDETHPFAPTPVAASAEHRAAAGAWLREVGNVGGCDNAPALARAAAEARGKGMGVVLWIHGRQDCRLGDAGAVAAAFVGGFNVPLLVEVRPADGWSVLGDELDDLRLIRPLAHGASIADGLTRLFRRWNATR